MPLHRFQRSALALCAAIALAPACVLAETPGNMTINGGFESYSQPFLGNNLNRPNINPWAIFEGRGANVVAVDGTNVYGKDGPKVDAEAQANRSVQHYLDVNGGANTVYQSFIVPACLAGDRAPRTVTIAGYFSSRDNSRGNGYMTLYAGQDLTGAQLASTGVVTVGNGDSQNEAWTRVSASATVAPGSWVTVAAWLNDPTNFDNGLLTFSDAECKSTTLTLRKVWQGAQAGASATLTASGRGQLLRTFTSTAQAPGQTDTDTVASNVFPDDVIALAETGAPAGYYSKLTCTGAGAAVSGNTLTVGGTLDPAAPIVCTYTNSPNAQPALGLVKTASVADTNGDGITGDAGDTVTYTFTLRNDGNAPLSNVRLADTLAGLSNLQIAWPDAAAPNTLAVGAQATGSATYVLTAADAAAQQVVNSATLSADPVGGVTPPPQTASVTTPTTAAQPSLALEKTADVPDTNGDGLKGGVGDVVTFSYRITNKGNVRLSNVKLTDKLADLSALTIAWPDPANPGVLPVGASATATATYTLTAADVAAGKLESEATATADAVSGAAGTLDATAEAGVPTVKPPVAGAPTPVPVDSPWALLALGSVIAWMARRRVGAMGA